MTCIAVNTAEHFVFGEVLICVEEKHGEENAIGPG